MTLEGDIARAFVKDALSRGYTGFNAGFRAELLLRYFEGHVSKEIFTKPLTAVIAGWFLDDERSLWKEVPADRERRAAEILEPFRERIAERMLTRR